MSALRSPADRLERQGAFLSRTDLAELGLPRRVVDAVFRDLPHALELLDRDIAAELQETLAIPSEARHEILAELESQTQAAKRARSVHTSAHTSGHENAD